MRLKILELSADNFSEVGDIWYSTAFMQEELDSLITVAIWADGTGEASLQGSMNEIDWISLTGTEFPINDAGLQTFSDCHIGLKYRIKSTIAPTKAQVII